MHTKLVRATPDFVYHFTVREHGGYTNLTIESQWLKAKNPLDRQTKLSINLDANGLQALRSVLSN